METLYLSAPLPMIFANIGLAMEAFVSVAMNKDSGAGPVMPAALASALQGHPHSNAPPAGLLFLGACHSWPSGPVHKW